MTTPPPLHLYHGTSSRHLRAILKHGLKPRGRKKSLWAEHPSRPDHVYLTQAYAIEFAKNATDRGGHAAILRLDTAKLDSLKLYADEDALEAFNRDRDKDRWPTLEERTRFYRDTWQHVEVARNWRGSLAFLGNCSHHGPIPPAAISGVAIVERQSPLWFMSDPTITPINYRIMGGFYRALSAFPFEGEAAIEREREDAIAGGLYLNNLAKLPAGTGYAAYTAPLPVRDIISASERMAA